MNRCLKWDSMEATNALCSGSLHSRQVFSHSDAFLLRRGPTNSTVSLQGRCRIIIILRGSLSSTAALITEAGLDAELDAELDAGVLAAVVAVGSHDAGGAPTNAGITSIKGVETVLPVPSLSTHTLRASNAEQLAAPLLHAAEAELCRCCLSWIARWLSWESNLIQTHDT